MNKFGFETNNYIQGECKMNVKFVGGATIFVKVLPITNTRGKRLKARLGNGATAFLASSRGKEDEDV